MSLFLGTHAPRLDDKGRLFLPAKYREDLAAGLVVTRGQEHCLYVFTSARFAELAMGFSNAPFTSAPARDLHRLFFSGAFDEVPDKTGRVTIPAKLREYADLRRDVVVIGAGDRLEIWDAPTWDAWLATNEDAFSALSSAEVVPGP
jgi:MraZ protein